MSVHLFGLNFSFLFVFFQTTRVQFNFWKCCVICIVCYLRIGVHIYIKRQTKRNMFFFLNNGKQTTTKK